MKHWNHVYNEVKINRYHAAGDNYNNNFTHNNIIMIIHKILLQLMRCISHCQRVVDSDGT